MAGQVGSLCILLVAPIAQLDRASDYGLLNEVYPQLDSQEITSIHGLITNIQTPVQDP